jgi:hypothetical protein
MNSTIKFSIYLSGDINISISISPSSSAQTPLTNDDLEGESSTVAQKLL